MSSIDQLHVEDGMLKVREHSELVSAESAHSTTRDTPKKWMKGTLFSGHRITVEPMMLANDRKATLQSIHTDAGNKAVNSQKKKYSG